MNRSFWALMIILGIIAACCVMEVVLRSVEENSFNSIITDPSSGLLIYRPNTSFEHAEGCYDNTVVVNSEGLHAPPVPEKGPKVFRIVVVGSSFVEGVQVPISQLFTTLLQDELNAQPGRRYTYQVIPIGFSGNGTLLDIFYYERFGESLKPDLVINLATEIDLQQNLPSGTVSPQFDPQGNLILTLPKPTTAKTSFALSVKNILRESQFAVSLYNRYLILKQNADDDLASASLFPHPAAEVTATSSSSEDDATIWSVEEKLLPAFSALVARDGARFMLASWTTSEASTSTAETLAPHFASIAKAAPFTYLDLVPSIAQQSQTEGASPSWSCDIHWDADGNRYAAQALFQYLEAHPSLIGS